MNSSWSAWWNLTKESFLILRRDKIFIPVIMAGLAVAVFANIARDWSIEDSEKILFDIGIAGFRITGAVVAILWGVRMITDPLQDRSIELRIASPSARFVWILARFTGLSTCLILMGLMFTLVWQVLMAMNHYGPMSNLQSWTLGLLILEWLTLGSIGILCGTIAGFSTALFITFSAWIAGLLAPLVAATMDPSSDPLQRKAIEFIASIWNFQRFNLLDQLEAGQKFVNITDLTQRLTWGCSMVVGCLILASWIFQEKDLT